MAEKYRLAKIKNRNGDLSKRWYVEYYAWSRSEHKLKRQVRYIESEYETAEQRYLRGQGIVQSINNYLEAGKYHIKEDVKVKSIDSAFDEVLEVQRRIYAQRTYESYLSVSRDFLDFIKKREKTALTQLKYEDVQAYSDYLLTKRKVVARTVNGRIGYINTLMNLIVDRKYLEENPFLSWKKLKTGRTVQFRLLTEEEQEKIKKAVAHKHGLKLCIKMIYYLWLRTRECTLVKLSDIDLKNGRIRVICGNTKNKRTEFITIPPPFVRDLMLMELNQYPQDWYLLGKDGKPTPQAISDNHMTTKHRELREKIELAEDVKLYNWKRCGVVAAYMAGVGIRAIKKQGRWTSLQDVDIYLEDCGVYDNQEIIMKMPNF